MVRIIKGIAMYKERCFGAESQPLMPVPTTKGKTLGICSKCRRVYVLRKNGELPYHGYYVS